MRISFPLLVALAVFSFAGTANAFVINYLMDLTVAGEWTLWANTDAPGGIASIVVDIGAGADPVATSFAPRSEIAGSAFAGFTLGNIFANKQAFAGQNTSNAGSLKYGNGYQSIPDATFAPAPFNMAPGSTAVLAPVGLGHWAPDDGRHLNGFVKFYTGTGNLTFGTAYKQQQPAAFGGVFATPGLPPVTGPGPNLTATYSVIPVPEPAMVGLAAFSIPAIVFFIRRSRNANKSRTATSI